MTFALPVADHAKEENVRIEVAHVGAAIVRICRVDTVHLQLGSLEVPFAILTLAATTFEQPLLEFLLLDRIALRSVVRPAK